MSDKINHPDHYTSHPSGVECIDIVEHMPFNIGSAIKYLWRVDSKDSPVENLQKAKWFVERELEKREREEEEVIKQRAQFVPLPDSLFSVNPRIFQRFIERVQRELGGVSVEAAKRRLRHEWTDAERQIMREELARGE